MKRLFKTILVIIAVLIVICFVLLLLPILLFMLMLWMIFGGSRPRIFKSRYARTGYEEVNATFSEAAREPYQPGNISSANDEVIDISAQEVKEVKDKE